jgi:hypothetical protein
MMRSQDELKQRALELQDELIETNHKIAETELMLEQTKIDANHTHTTFKAALSRYTLNRAHQKKIWFAAGVTLSLLIVLLILILIFVIYP